MPEVFQRAATTLAGSFSAEHGRLSFGSGVPTTLVMNLGAQYTQNVSRLYEVGSNGAGQGAGSANMYYVGGRSAGNMSIARVLGPAVLMSAFYAKFGDVCNAAGNTIQLLFNPLACNGGNATFTAKFCVLVQIGISLNSQEMIVNEQSNLMFSGMEYTGP